MIDNCRIKLVVFVESQNNILITNLKLKEARIRGVFRTQNLGLNIYRLFHFLAQFLFTSNETELDYYHQKENLRVVSLLAEPQKTLSKISRNYLKFLDLMASTQPVIQNPNFHAFHKKLQKISLKTQPE